MPFLDTPGLENVTLVRSIRKRYERMALCHYLRISGVQAEQRLSDFYQLFPHFRRATVVLKEIFADVQMRRPDDLINWTPLMNQVVENMPDLASPSSYNSPPNSQ